MNTLSTVTRWLATEVVPPHCTREAATTRDSDHINPLNTLEGLRAELLADRVAMPGRDTKLTYPLLRLTFRLRNHRPSRFTTLTSTVQSRHMATLSPRRLATRPVTKTQLHSVVTVPLLSPNLQHNARPSLN
jgi:hypothetical protein